MSAASRCRSEPACSGGHSPSSFSASRSNNTGADLYPLNYYGGVHDEVLSYIRRHELMRAGDRVGLAVSGGADSVALLRIMLELRSELGVVLAVVHFNHKIRGIEADADEHFVAGLAAARGLEFHSYSGDTPGYAHMHGISLEAAGRELRYRYFRELISEGKVTGVATAHTMDDQAETILLRVFRGAGTRGMAGIFPQLPVASRQSPEHHGGIVRPLLAVRRAELRTYLKAMDQTWREDASNLDVKHTRNRLRHEVLPVIEREFNPSIVRVLAELAEVARGEEEFWEKQIPRLAQNDNAVALDRARLLSEPLAFRRRLVRAAAQQAGVRLEFAHVEEILEVAGRLQPLETKGVELPNGWVLTISARELKFELGRHLQKKGTGYVYRLPIPGEVLIPELAKKLRAVVLPAELASSGYNRRHWLDTQRLASELTVRNWHPGDRFRPAHSKSPRKLKELLLRRRIPQPQRAFWPVVLSGESIVWVLELGAAADAAADDRSGTVVVIEEVTAGADENGG